MINGFRELRLEVASFKNLYQNQNQHQYQSEEESEKEEEEDDMEESD